MVTIRPAKMEEYAAAVKFYSDLIDSMREAEYKPEWKMGVYPTYRMLQNAIENRTLYFAHHETCFAGAMILNHECSPEYDSVKWQTDADKDEVMVIHALGVSPSYQGKGIAKQIVSKIIEICEQRSVKVIRLDVLKKNIPAAKLYSAMGFQHIASIQMFYEDTGLADFELYELVL